MISGILQRLTIIEFTDIRLVLRELPLLEWLLAGILWIAAINFVLFGLWATAVARDRELRSPDRAWDRSHGKTSRLLVEVVSARRVLQRARDLALAAAAEDVSLNEKRNIEPSLDPDSPESRTRSDVAPKPQQSGAPARHISGLRPAVHLPAAEAVPPPPLTPEDLLEEGWENDDESGPTLLDAQGSVPPGLVAEARALSDPLGEREPETREVSTREVDTRSFSRDEAPTGEMPTVLNALRPSPEAGVSG
jgi:hypothetical protein